MLLTAPVMAGSGSPTPHVAHCSLTGLAEWDPARTLDEWAASLVCVLDNVSSPPHSSAAYEPTMNSTGWDTFDVVVLAAGCQQNASIGCQSGAASAGFLEGLLSAHRISDHLYNILAHGRFLRMDHSAVNESAPEWRRLVEYEAKQEAWLLSQVANAPSDPQRSVLATLFAQQAGIAAGLARSGASLYGLSPWRAAVTVNLMAEMGDVLDHLFPSRRVQWFDEGLSLVERSKATLKREHCSAFVALASYNEDLYVGHNMWWQFYAMMPVLKTVTWQALPGLGARRVQMTSFPGALSSIDDFYSLPSPRQRLVVMETTNPIRNTSLFDALHPSSIWCWMRVMSANLLAESATEWVRFFSRHNSGTYNNMWLVVDYKAFTPRTPLASGVLTIAEQVMPWVRLRVRTRVRVRARARARVRVRVSRAGDSLG